MLRIKDVVYLRVMFKSYIYIYYLHLYLQKEVMYVHILDYMSTDSPTFLCLMYNVLFRRGKIMLKKKNSLFVELLFIKSKLFYS